MKILGIEVEGFCSIIGKVKYKYDRPGINLITGKNGYGKTTIFNALAYGCYGQTLKLKSTVLPWPHILDDGYSGLKVRVKLEDELEIIRCQEYKGKVMGRMGNNRLVIVHHGKELQNLRDKKDAQRFIDNKLGYSWALFKSAVLFPQELNSLLEDDGPTKKRVFDEAFASAFINEAKKKAENELKTLTLIHDDYSNQLNTKSAVLETNNALLEQIHKANAGFAIEKARTISRLRKDVRVIQDKNKALSKANSLDKKKPRSKKIIKELYTRRDEINATIDYKAEAEEFQLMLDITRYQEEIGSYSSTMLLAKETKTKKCNSCGQALRGESLKKFRQQLKSKYSTAKRSKERIEILLENVTNRRQAVLEIIQVQKSMKGDLKKMDKRIAKKEKELEAIEEVYAQIRVNRSRIKGLKKEISRIRKNVQKTPTENIEQEIRDLGLAIGHINLYLSEITERLDIQKWLIKDPLSNSGLKAFIFDSMLRRVNHYLKYYKKFIGFDVKVEIDLESSNKDFYISIWNPHEVPYPDLSKGQKQLAKVAICFALHKAMQVSKPINILLVDELFEALDPDNVEIVGNILMEEAKTKSVHVITHHKSFEPLNCYKTFITLNDKKQTVIEQKYKVA